MASWFLRFFSIPTSFQRLTPRAEVEYKSPTYGVRGFIDAIHEKDGHVVLMDYKTSKTAKIREAIEKSGGVIIDVKFNTEGVRIEK